MDMVCRLSQMKGASGHLIAYFPLTQHGNGRTRNRVQVFQSPVWRVKAVSKRNLRIDDIMGYENKFIKEIP